MSFLPIVVRDIGGPLQMLEQQMRMAEEVFPYLGCGYSNISKRCNRRNPDVFQWLGLDGNHGCALDKVFNKHEIVTQDKDKFLVKLDIQHYTPEEIAIKVLDENTIVVEAKHESKDNNGSTFRRLAREFVLPPEYDLKRIETRLSKNGILSIMTPMKIQSAHQERVIPVTHVETKKS